MRHMLSACGPGEEKSEAINCECDKCMGEPDDIDIEENIKTREGVREPWTGA